MARLSYHDFKNNFERELSTLTPAKKISRIKIYLAVNRFFLAIYDENIFWMIVNAFILLILFIVTLFIPNIWNILLPCFLLGSFLSYHFSFRHKFKHETMGEIDAIETEILVLEDIKKEIIKTQEV